MILRLILLLTMLLSSLLDSRVFADAAQQLRLTIKRNNPQAATEAIGAGAKVNQDGACGIPLINYAAMENRYDVLRLLLLAGADANRSDLHAP